MRVSKWQTTHSTNKALEAPLSPERLNRSHSVSNTTLARFALRRAQPHMARLTVRMPAEHREAHLVPVLIQRDVERAVAFDADLVRVLVRMRMAVECGPLAGFARGRRREEWVAALCTEEVLFVVCPFPKCWVIECDEPLVDDGRLAGIALRSECL